MSSRPPARLVPSPSFDLPSSNSSDGCPSHTVSSVTSDEQPPNKAHDHYTQPGNLTASFEYRRPLLESSYDDAFVTDEASAAATRTTVPIETAPSPLAIAKVSFRFRTAHFYISWELVAICFRGRVVIVEDDKATGGENAGTVQAVFPWDPQAVLDAGSAIRHSVVRVANASEIRAMTTTMAQAEAAALDVRRDLRRRVVKSPKLHFLVHAQLRFVGCEIRLDGHRTMHFTASTTLDDIDAEAIVPALFHEYRCSISLSVNTGTGVVQRDLYIASPVGYNIRPTAIDTGRDEGTVLVAEVGFRYRRAQYSVGGNVVAHCYPGAVLIVEGDRGEDAGTVERVQWIPIDERLRLAGAILRVATPMEDLAMREMVAQGEQAKPFVQAQLCKWVAERPHLKNKRIELVDCEFQADGAKLTVHFTAKERVTVGDFAKVLFLSYRCRVWMNQVNYRDFDMLDRKVGKAGRAV